MLKIKNLRGECQHCGKPIEFHAEHVGTTAECPHCSQSTELLLPVPAEESSPVRRKAIVFSVIAVIILLGGLIGAGVALKRAERLKAERSRLATKTDQPSPPQPDTPWAALGFRASLVTIERGTNNSLVFAVGTISNLTNKPRFGVRVELELRDATGIKVGDAKDYRAVLEPNAEWRFRAMVVNQRAVVARMVGITEDK